MSKPSHDQLQELIRTLILPFYHVKRDMLLPIGERRRENDAEHSWALAVLACALAPQIDSNLDVGRVSQYAIAHDLVEVYADDTSNFASAQELASKAEREEQALQQIEQSFAHFPWIAATIKDYERLDSDEARFVYALDKYLPVYFDYLDQVRMFRDRKFTHAAYTKALESHRKKAHSHPVVAEYYDAIRDLVDEHPEYFHQKDTDD
jgi:putative hydrolase of HD superfamily